LKYKDLTIEIQRMWACNKENDTSNIGGNWNHLKITLLSNIPGKHEVKELQTTAILCTAHRLREVLM
jgi:hypothetical protein